MRKLTLPIILFWGLMGAFLLYAFDYAMDKDLHNMCQTDASGLTSEQCQEAYDRFGND